MSLDIFLDRCRCFGSHLSWNFKTPYIFSAWNIHRMHSGMKQSKFFGAIDLVTNVVLLSCQTQIINYEYHVAILQNMVNLVMCILGLFVQPLVSFFCLKFKQIKFNV